MAWWSRKNKVPTGKPAPVSNNTYMKPEGIGTGPYVPVGSRPAGQGGATWAPRVGIEIPPIAGQDAMLVHYLQPPPDKPPETFYSHRNAHRIRDYHLEELSGDEGWKVEQYENEEAPNPWERDGPPVTGLRPTGALSPSQYRFLVPGKPIGIRGPRRLNGMHFSMASMHRGYPIGGMSPRVHFRNTYRIEPPPRDAQSGDMQPGNVTPAVTNMTYEAPSVPPSNRGGTFRL